MVSIKLFIVSYKGHKRLPITLESLRKTDFPRGVFLTVHIITNHSDPGLPFDLMRDIESDGWFTIEVLPNVLRPDFSNGHLSRSWNQALINGFQDLDNPNADIVVCSQDDSVFNRDWLYRLYNNFYQSDLEFIQGGHGDQFHAYKSEHVRKVGLWDERFCGLSRQAADYFFRSVCYNPDKVSIQDTLHSRVWQPIESDLESSRSYFVDPDVRSIDQVWENDKDNDNKITLDLLKHKYGIDPYPWSEIKLDRWIMAASHNGIFENKNFITYPYFEKKLDPNLLRTYVGY